MIPKATEAALASLHSALADELADRIKNGESKIDLVDCEGTVVEHVTKIPAGASTLSVARQFLKDNHIEAGIRDSQPMADLVDSLPFDDDTTDKLTGMN